MPFVVTSWATKVHRPRGTGHSKPNVIRHIGFFPCFHGISIERSRFRKIALLLFKLVCSSKAAIIPNRLSRSL